MELLTALGPGPITAGSVLLTLGMLVLAGRLVPLRQHEARVSDWKELAERWEKIAETQRQINETQAESTRELLEHARTSTQILRSWQSHREQGQP